MLDHLPGNFTDHVTAGRLSANPRVAKILEWISEVTRKGTLLEGGSELPQEEALPSGAPLKSILEGCDPQEGVLSERGPPLPREGPQESLPHEGGIEPPE